MAASFFAWSRMSSGQGSTIWLKRSPLPANRAQIRLFEVGFVSRHRRQEAVKKDTSHACLSLAQLLTAAIWPCPQSVACHRNEGWDFGKPIIAVANSFTQFVPGHVHLKDLGQLVAAEIERAGGVAKEFNTIAVDDGIAMGHGGMLYGLPSRELIADSVEYMANAHCADALVCISNCDKITPGMLMAALRLNIPAIFVSGGPMRRVRCNRATWCAQWIWWMR